MTRPSTTRQKINTLIALLTGQVREAFEAVIGDVVDNAVLREIIEAIQDGNFQRAFDVLGFSAAAMRPLLAAVERAYEQGGVFTGSTFPKYLNTSSGRAVFRFDVRNSRAEAWLRDHSASMVQRLSDEARTNVRNVMTDGMQRGVNPRTTALDIVGRVDPIAGKRVGGIIGLTNNQEYWVRNTRSDLLALDERYFTRKLRDKRFDGIVRRAIDSGKPLDVATVDKLVTRYKDRALKYRAETIARTEALQALNASEYEAIKQAVDSGAAREDDVKREWDSAGDMRVRPSHRKMDGQRVGLHEPFVTPGGARLLHPGDTSLGAPASEVVDCRCRAKTVIDWLANLD